MTKLVIDSCVLIKLFIDEPDSDQAVELLKHIYTNSIQVIAPDLLTIETIGVCMGNGVAAKKLCAFFNTNTALIESRPMNEAIMIQACDIAEKGSEKSGFPSYGDSIYHAYAIHHDSILITANKKHFSKTKSFGHIVMLEDWESIFHE